MIDLGKNAIMFGSSKCPACLSQVKILMDYFNGKKGLKILYYDLNVYDPPDFILERDGSYSMPTWYFPGGKIKRGIITDSRQFNSLLSKSKSSFGSSSGCTAGGVVPQIDSLATCGKNFPNGKGMEIPNSWMNTMEKKWGSGSDVLNGGTVGRELGPGNTSEIYSSNYLNNIRMAQPAGPLGTALSLNRTCNTMSSSNTYPSMTTVGIVTNSTSPQIVAAFGRKKKNRFGGSLYDQMGAAYELGDNQYVVAPNTFQQLYGGAIQNNLPRPYKVKSDLYVGSAPVYNPIKFGKIKEGSVLTVKKGKVKVKN
jgi:hypothetical protein